MASYRCPYCSALIEHKPELAGDRVQCSSCKGEYFEPTDPLPGVKPEKAPDLEFNQGGNAMALKPSDATAPAEAVNVETLQPIDMVMEMKRRGLQSVMLSQMPDAGQNVGVVFSDNLTQEQANDVILKAAVQIMQTKWPDVYQLVANRV